MILILAEQEAASSLLHDEIIGPPMHRDVHSNECVCHESCHNGKPNKKEDSDRYNVTVGWKDGGHHEEEC